MAPEPGQWLHGHRLAVDDGGAWLKLTALQLTAFDIERIVDPGPGAVPGKALKIDCAPGRKVLRQVGPRATVLKHVENAIHHRLQVRPAPAAARRLRW